jgi:hypothetical protein
MTWPRKSRFASQYRITSQIVVTVVEAFRGGQSNTSTQGAVGVRLQ